MKEEAHAHRARFEVVEVKQRSVFILLDYCYDVYRCVRRKETKWKYSWSKLKERAERNVGDHLLWEVWNGVCLLEYSDNYSNKFNIQRKETMGRKVHRPSRVDLKIGVSILLAYGKCERINIEKFDNCKMKEKTLPRMTDFVMFVVNLVPIRAENSRLIIVVFTSFKQSQIGFLIFENPHCKLKFLILFRHIVFSFARFFATSNFFIQEICYMLHCT